MCCQFGLPREQPFLADHADVQINLNAFRFFLGSTENFLDSQKAYLH